MDPNSASSKEKLWNDLRSQAEVKRNNLRFLQDSPFDDPQLLTKETFNYILCGGQYKGLKLSNTCVLDSLLTGLHIVYKTKPQIRDLLLMDPIIMAVMTFIDFSQYNEAKILWILNLEILSNDKTNFFDGEYINIRGHVKDHLPNLKNLRIATLYFDNERQSPDLEDAIFKMTLSAFEDFGDVMALGTKLNPTLILVDVEGRINAFPESDVCDCYERTFELQFLLLGIITADSNHMVLCIKLNGDWLLYDDQQRPLFRHTSFAELKSGEYVTYLAAYINTTKMKKD
ncbi:uncharacterized protein [Lepisosteus oculatus]|uniref:uncharacterized protein n=1 Tax=Lepisosteus oculatus TaxID=7918 RepID=UPI0007404E60|nr:PREDICTED: uncharacterized protein LOC107076949 isoform X1 [Lepisosteus oculatus]